MGYITGQRKVIRTVITKVGAKCDKCGTELQLGRCTEAGWLELRVGGLMMVLYPCQSGEEPHLLYCKKCAEQVIEMLPGLEAILREEPMEE